MSGLYALGGVDGEYDNFLGAGGEIDEAYDNFLGAGGGVDIITLGLCSGVDGESICFYITYI
jgi:hypothetical protein